MQSKNIFFTLFIFLVLSVSAKAQWVQTGGPQGITSVSCMERVGSDIWIGYAKGIYISSDEGLSWNKSSLINNKVCCHIKSYGDSIFIIYYSFDTATADYNYNIISSIDAGATWATPILLYSSNSTSSTYFLYRCSNQLIARINYNYYVSDDWGASWPLMTTPIFGNSNFGQAENNTLIQNYYSIGNPMPSGVYIASNDIQTWEVIDTIHEGIQSLAYKDSVFYLVLNNYDSTATYYSLVIKSDDFGLTWDTIHTFPYGQMYNYIYSFNNKFYMQYQLNYIVSDDLGYTWTPITFPSGFYPAASIPLNNGDQLVNLGNKIARYLPDQNIYFQTETGILAGLINCLEEHNGVLYTGTPYKSLRSWDGGMTWMPFGNGYSGLVDILFRGDTILALCKNSSLARSFDNGLTWDSIGLVNSGFASLEEYNGRLYSGGNATNYSDDYGLTWNSISLTVNNIPGSCSLGPNIIDDVFFLKVDSTLFMVSEDGVVANYNNQNATWEYLFCFWSTMANPNIKLYKLENYIVVSGGQGLYISNNNGNSWTTPTCNGLPAANGSSYPYFPTNLISINGTWFGSIGSFGVYYTNNQGTTWQQLQPGVQPFSSWGGLTLLNNVLYSGSYFSSVWRRSGAMELITGNVYLDVNNNGIKDNGETNLNQIVVKTATVPFAATTNASGNYSLLCDAIGDTLSVVLPTNFCSSNPAYYITNGAAINQDFGIYTLPNIYDLSVDITNVNVFRPGFQTHINLTVKNNGSVAQSGEVKLILDSVEQFISSVPPPDLQAGDSLIWFTDTLDFLESQSISVITKTSVTAPLADTVHCFASVAPILNDTIPADNYAELHEIILGSFDPNDKTCSFGNYYTTDQLANNEELSYVIRFQNTGNFQADFVHIKDTLSNYFDLSTFRVISSSHLMHWSMSGTGVVDFYFDNILLPASSLDELNSHGFVKYGIKCKNSVMLGNALVNTAYIYFDFNPPITTNATATLVTYPIVILNIEPVNKVQNNTILVYPNPTAEVLYLDLRGINDDDLRLQVFDFVGNIVKNEILQKTAVSKIEIDALPSGIYFGNVLSKSQKIGSFKFIVNKQ